jgi:hypothetical protein
MDLRTTRTIVFVARSPRVSLGQPPNKEENWKKYTIYSLLHRSTKRMNVQCIGDWDADIGNPTKLRAHSAHAYVRTRRVIPDSTAAAGSARPPSCAQ